MDADRLKGDEFNFHVYYAKTLDRLKKNNIYKGLNINTQEKNSDGKNRA